MPNDFLNLHEVAPLVPYGFKVEKGGAHTSRTMMLSELSSLLRMVPSDAPDAAYEQAVIEQNALSKDTVSSRRKSLSHLKELYALTCRTPLFAVLRNLYRHSPESLPQLALLVALARDPLLRASAEAVLPVGEGETVTPAQISAAIETQFPRIYSPKSLLSISQNCASTWAQAGLLAGRMKKIRCRAQPSAVATVLAFLLAEISGHHGSSVFSSLWCRALDLDPERARSLGFEAHRLGLLNLRAIGDVVEIGFPSLPVLLRPAA